ncbi:MAG: hypothetical protein AAF600_13635 [Bacteroidota bacterium]
MAYAPHSQEVIIREDASINAQSIIALLKMIQAFFSSERADLYFRPDQTRYDQSKLVKAFLTQNKKRSFGYLYHLISLIST